MPPICNGYRPPARITAVTVYPDRALTSRSASLNLKPGSYLVTFDSLPALVQDDSVRVEGKGSAGVTIVGLEVKRAFLEQSGEKRVQELDEEIRALEQRSGVLDAKKAGLSSQEGVSRIDPCRLGRPHLQGTGHRPPHGGGTAGSRQLCRRGCHQD